MYTVRVINVFKCSQLTKNKFRFKYRVKITKKKYKYKI